MSVLTVPSPITVATIGALHVEVYADRGALGRAAAALVADALRERLVRPGEARVVFASAPSQNEFLAALLDEPGVDWARVAAFHMDEYLGLAPDAPQNFGQWLQNRLFDHRPFAAVHRLRSDAPDVAEECARYEALLRAASLDVVCLGIGENGHLAFNDPPVADFDDTAWVKPVEIDEVSRNQQVHDGAFATVDEVPRVALTLTIPALLSGRLLSAVVPGPRKAEAIRRTLTGPISTDCPASILRRCPHARLLLDVDSAALVSL